MRSKFAVWAFTLFVFVGCSKKDSGCSVAVTPTGVSSAPTLTFYYGPSTSTTGTALTAANQISGSIASGGCGPFGVWETGNGGEVATELEIRFTSRMGVFALADGVVTAIQTTTSPVESGEVEGVWVRYGSAYVVKYVHVKDPVVILGQQITSGQKIGDTVALNNGQYFWEAELRFKTGSTTYAKAWSSLLSNATAFNSLFGSGNCGVGSFTGIDGSSPTTAANWLNTNLSSGQWDVSGTDQTCAF